MTSMWDSYEWYLKQDLSNYAGKWVAIIDKKVVATSKHADEVIKKAKILSKKEPLLAKVSNKLRIL